MRAARALVVAATAVAVIGLAAPAANRFFVPDGPGAPGGLGGSVAAVPAEMDLGAGPVVTAIVGGGVFLVRRRKKNRAGS
ncbi:hypothetical protein [Streptomyces sp. NBC_01363]|uniref:hypothetical protein n=1 Tax=Streptomyces sp. NBC_01363 TaxID=2903840 RepID=UPI0022557A87|nr:hypothetical protein [Streptomyces sp. NBC_01363]MCX4736301.1 hypothetical protein [Streptomyces sp. NBC_01363]